MLLPFLKWLRQSLWAQLVYNPFHAMDLTDETGRTDHGKVLPAILLFAAIIAQFTHQQFDAIILVILGSLAYGYSSWRTFLKSRSVTHNTDVDVELKHTITETVQRRDAENAVDPTRE